MIKLHRCYCGVLITTGRQSCLKCAQDWFLAWRYWPWAQ